MTTHVAGLAWALAKFNTVVVPAAIQAPVGLEVAVDNAVAVATAMVTGLWTGFGLMATLEAIAAWARAAGIHVMAFNSHIILCMAIGALSTATWYRAAVEPRLGAATKMT
jgi:hypothetical protein